MQDHSIFPLSSLPVEILLEIFKYLNDSDLNTLLGLPGVPQVLRDRCVILTEDTTSPYFTRELCNYGCIIDFTQPVTSKHLASVQRAVRLVFAVNSNYTFNQYTNNVRHYCVAAITRPSVLLLQHEPHSVATAHDFFVRPRPHGDPNLHGGRRLGENSNNAGFAVGLEAFGFAGFTFPLIHNLSSITAEMIVGFSAANISFPKLCKITVQGDEFPVSAVEKSWPLLAPELTSTAVHRTFQGVKSAITYNNSPKICRLELLNVMDFPGGVWRDENYRFIEDLVISDETERTSTDDSAEIFSTQSLFKLKNLQFDALRTLYINSRFIRRLQNITLPQVQKMKIVVGKGPLHLKDIHALKLVDLYVKGYILSSLDIHGTSLQSATFLLEKTPTMTKNIDLSCFRSVKNVVLENFYQSLAACPQATTRVTFSGRKPPSASFVPSHLRNYVVLTHVPILQDFTMLTRGTTALTKLTLSANRVETRKLDVINLLEQSCTLTELVVRNFRVGDKCERSTAKQLICPQLPRLTLTDFSKSKTKRGTEFDLRRLVMPQLAFLETDTVFSSSESAFLNKNSPLLKEMVLHIVARPQYTGHQIKKKLIPQQHYRLLGITSMKKLTVVLKGNGEIDSLKIKDCTKLSKLVFDVDEQLEIPKLSFKSLPNLNHGLWKP